MMGRLFLCPKGSIMKQLTRLLFLMALSINFANATLNQWGQNLINTSQKIDNAIHQKIKGKKTSKPKQNHQNSKKSHTKNLKTQPQAQIQKPNEVTIVAAGDIMIGSSFPSIGFLPDDDAKGSFDTTKPYLKGDVVFGNLEGVLLDEGDSTKCPNISPDPVTGYSSLRCFAFKMPTRYGQLIKEAGFDVLSLANNHTGDFGDTGRASTMQVLDKLGIYHAGLLERPTVMFEKNGVKYGMVAFAPNIGTVSIHDIEQAKQYVQTLDKQVDIVMVSFHGGAEGANHTRVPKTTEIFLNENRGDVYKFSRSLIDVGADIVIGHGPHVTRAVDLYKDRFIAYSLGNFNTYGAFNIRGVNGIAPIIQVKLKNTGEFISADVVSIYQTKDKGVLIDKQNQAFDELKRLTNLDFAESGLKFDNNQIWR